MAEIKEQIAKLSADQRAELAALISHLNHREDPAYHAELERRLAQMDAGHKASQAEIEASHHR